MFGLISSVFHEMQKLVNNNNNNNSGLEVLHRRFGLSRKFKVPTVFDIFLDDAVRAGTQKLRDFFQESAKIDILDSFRHKTLNAILAEMSTWKYPADGSLMPTEIGSYEADELACLELDSDLELVIMVNHTGNGTIAFNIMTSVNEDEATQQVVAYVDIAMIDRFRLTKFIADPIIEVVENGEEEEGEFSDDE